MKWALKPSCEKYENGRIILFAWFSLFMNTSKLTVEGKFYKSDTIWNSWETAIPNIFNSNRRLELRAYIRRLFLNRAPPTTEMSGTLNETEQYCIPTVAVPTKQYHLSYDAWLLH